jgi:hypothetical protein
MKLIISALAGALLAACAPPTVRAAFVVEADNVVPVGKAFDHFVSTPSGTGFSLSATPSTALGLAGNQSAFGNPANATGPDLYTFYYTPGADADNTVFGAGTFLGNSSVTDSDGGGLGAPTYVSAPQLATGLSGGASGIYNVYFTVPPSTNVDPAGSVITVNNNVSPVVLNPVNMNNGGSGPDEPTGGAFTGGANSLWLKIASVPLTTGNTYTVTIEANNPTFVSQRAHGVMWEFVAPLSPPGPAVPGKLYGTSGSAGNLLTIDPITGIGSVVGPMFISAPALAIDPTTRLMYVGQGGGNPNVYLVDPNTASTVLVGSTGLGLAAIGDMDFRGDGALYAAVNIIGDGGSGSDHLATIDKVTGLVTLIGPFGNVTGGSPDIDGIEAIAFSPAGALYGASTKRGAAGPDSKLFMINPLTGRATPIAPILDALGNSPSGGITSLQFTNDGTLYGGTARALSPATDGGFLVTINPITGRFSFVGALSTTGGPSLAALAATYVPEPSAILLLSVAAIAFFVADAGNRRDHSRVIAAPRV